eukprot:scaffold293764_cov30-Tisochrysis_lutea.AAC.6
MAESRPAQQHGRGVRQQWRALRALRGERFGAQKDLSTWVGGGRRRRTNAAGRVATSVHGSLDGHAVSNHRPVCD